MFQPTQNIYPVQTIFGAGYVAETHCEQSNWVSDRDTRFAEFAKSLGALLFGDDGPTKH